MIFLTEQAVTKLKVLILEHPEDPIVRLMVRDLDEARLSYNITLEDKIQPDDEVLVVKGLTVGVEGAECPAHARNYPGLPGARGVYIHSS